uniref:Ig-like domain-containing protein n=1 Tax=Sinocyclocheilus grahami TaxID=75366 RepID=A0A672SKU9_SINGR
MAIVAMTKIFYLSFGFWLILGSVTIPCHYDKKYTQQNKHWVSEINNNKKKYTNTTDENLSVIDHPDQSLFTVTMRNLQNKHTEDYYSPDVSVVSSSVSGHEGSDISVQCLYSYGYQNEVKRWSRYKDQSCYTVGRTDTSQNSSVQISDDDDGGRSFTVLMTGLRLTDSGWYFCSVGNKLNSVQPTATKTKPDKGKHTSVFKHFSLIFLLSESFT